MAKLKVIDREACRYLRDAIDENLAEIAAELGVSVKAGSASFTGKNVTFKVEFAILDASGQAQTKESDAFKLYATSYGLKADDLGREFVDRNVRYKIIGLMPRSTRFPILCQRVGTDKQIKFPVETVRLRLKKCQGNYPCNEVSIGLVMPVV